MKFLDYIKGQRKGNDAHRIEKNSMTDPFLYDAIDGFDSIEDNHIERINSIQNRIRAKSASSGRQRHIWQSVAASAIIIIAAGAYFLSDYHKSDLHAQEAQANIIIDLYVPQTYYVENIVPIAKENAAISKKAYKPQISKFKPNVKMNSTISEDEKNSLLEKKQDTAEIIIEIYAPNGSNH